MNANTPLTPDVQKKADSRRKRKALLAGGVVLGLGAVITLAAWSDDVFADGVFDTGTFNIEGSANGTDWDEHATEGEAAKLSFQINALQMAPNETVYAPFSIRTDSGTSLPGEITLTGTLADGAYAGLLTYEIFEEDSHDANCNPDDASALGTPWAAPTLANAAAAPTTSPIAIGAEQESPAHLCIAVTLANQTAVEAVTDTSTESSVIWEFNGLST